MLAPVINTVQQQVAIQPINLCSPSSCTNSTTSCFPCDKSTDGHKTNATPNEQYIVTPPTPPVNQVTTPQENITLSHLPGVIIPYEPNWDDQPDFDLMEIVS